ncbi:hypothetical protein D4764_03G0005650 [Takifugu flavidus]|uniref:Uncharacterized protein n=1 Tax=Takifugu flavidus TaxID=433684 RepID=A0A5C6NDG9_9TELE|nr:hypothetical protein D4764_03G0005650 [Takifugu flavidus]
MVLKLRTIMDSPSHPLHNTVDKLRSSFSNRLLQPRCSKERDRKSLLPSAIRLYNSSKPSQEQQLCLPLGLLPGSSILVLITPKDNLSIFISPLQLCLLYSL